MIDFDRALESIRSIKLTGGMFGKTSLLVMVLAVCMAAVAIKIGTWWFALAAMLPVTALAYYALKRCFDFAEKNPQAAIMDGAELLIHEKLVHERKGNIIVGSMDATIDHPQPSMKLEEVERQDPPPRQISSPDGEKD